MRRAGVLLASLHAPYAVDEAYGAAARELESYDVALPVSASEMMARWRCVALKFVTFAAQALDLFDTCARPTDWTVDTISETAAAATTALIDDELRAAQPVDLSEKLPETVLNLIRATGFVDPDADLSRAVVVALRASGRALLRPTDDPVDDDDGGERAAELYRAAIVAYFDVVRDGMCRRDEDPRATMQLCLSTLGTPRQKRHDDAAWYAADSESDDA